jgi:hypothetical protein
MNTLKKVLNSFKPLKTVCKSIFSNQGSIVLEFYVSLAIILLIMLLFGDRTNTSSLDTDVIVPYLVPMFLIK